MLSKMKNVFKKIKRISHQEKVEKETKQKSQEAAFNIYTKNRDNQFKEIIERQIHEFNEKKEMPLFNNIEIETVSACNGTCSFCPVNKEVDVRETIFMSEELFEKIVKELKEIDYDGSVALHSNNEPLIDKRIIRFAQQLRKEVPNSFIYIYTNGTLLTLDKFKELVKILDLIIIDNYNDELEFIKPVKKIYDYCNQNIELKEKVVIEKRLQNQVLTSRGGQATNREEIVDIESSCLVPFNKIVIQPDGKIPLCCCDLFATELLGNLNENNLTEIWRGVKHRNIIEKLSSKDYPRKKIPLCENCDTTIEHMRGIPFTKEDVLNSWKIHENQ